MGRAARIDYVGFRDRKLVMQSMSALSWLVPSFFYLLIAVMALRAVAIAVARRKAGGSEAELKFAQLDLLPLNTPGEAAKTYKAARLVLKSGAKGPLRGLILACAAAWLAMFGFLLISLIVVMSGQLV